MCGQRESFLHLFFCSKEKRTAMNELKKFLNLKGVDSHEWDRMFQQGQERTCLSREEQCEEAERKCFTRGILTESLLTSTQGLSMKDKKMA